VGETSFQPALLVFEQHVDAGAVEEADEVGLVLPGPNAAGEAGAQLAEHDERHQYQGTLRLLRRA
jgi:hypothetical protein